MSEPLHVAVLKRALAFIDRKKMARTTFGMNAAGTPNLLDRVESGEITLKTLQKVTDYLDSHTINGGKNAGRQSRHRG